MANTLSERAQNCVQRANQFVGEIQQIQKLLEEVECGRLPEWATVKTPGIPQLLLDEMHADRLVALKSQLMRALEAADSGAVKAIEKAHSDVTRQRVVSEVPCEPEALAGNRTPTQTAAPNDACEHC